MTKKVRPQLLVGIAVEDELLQAIAEAVVLRLQASPIQWKAPYLAPPALAAVVCEFPSTTWLGSSERVEQGGPAIPHLLILRREAAPRLPGLLQRAKSVRQAVAGCVSLSEEADALPSLLRQYLAPLVTSSLTALRVAAIEDALAGGDPHLRSLVVTILRDPRHHTTLRRALRDATPSARSLRRAIHSAGFAPPSHFVRVVRAFGIHALLCAGSSVGMAAAQMGYASPDTARKHFGRAFAMRPHAACDLSTEELAARMIRRA